jgi:hypothetical protein
VTVDLRQTLRNARVIGEMTVKGIERVVRNQLAPRGSTTGEPTTAQKSRVTPPEYPEPFEGYALMTARQIIAQAPSWSSEQRAEARRYEESSRNRKSVLEALR